MLTYATLDRQVVDLGGLDDDERACFARCLAAYRAGMAWGEFSRIVEGPDNPLLRTSGGRMTRNVRDHSLFKAVRDLEDRLGVQQGELLPEPGDDLASDPVADEWIPSADAARRAGVTLSGLHGAIRRGEIIAHPAKPGGTRLAVSRNSLARWTPNRVRQAAGHRTRSAARHHSQR